MKAIVGARLIDGTGVPPIPNTTVIVDGDSILGVHPAGSVEVPYESEVIDAAGLTLMPGLIDTHDHLAHFGHDLAVRWGIDEPQSLRHARVFDVLKQTLETGFTTVRDAAGLDAGFRDAVDRGLMPGPRLRVALNFITPTAGQADRTSPSGHSPAVIPQPDLPLGIADGPFAMRAKVREMVRAGADVIKTAVNGWGRPTRGLGPRDQIMTREELDALVDEAHVMSRKVMCHVLGGPGLRMAVDAGVDSIEHGSYLNQDPELLEMMARKGIYFAPTFSVFYYHERRGSPHESARALHFREHHAESLRLALEAGVQVVAGCDAGAFVHGNNAHELTCLVERGMKPMDAIRAATGRAAQCLGLENSIGTVKAGLKADLILVEGDPLEDVSILEYGRAVNWVMKDGEVYVDRRLSRLP